MDPKTGAGNDLNGVFEACFLLSHVYLGSLSGINSSFDALDLTVSSMFGMRGGVRYFLRLSTDFDRRLNWHNLNL